jgi:phosphoglycerate dehydrogenase-like enzyme
MLQVAFAGTFAARLEQPARRHLTVPCEIVVSDEARIVPRLGEVDVLVAMAFTVEMARSASRLKLVQVPGAGLDRIDRSALPDGVLLANAYGHETGIAEYVIGTMLTLTPTHMGMFASTVGFNYSWVSSDYLLRYPGLSPFR